MSSVYLLIFVSIAITLGAQILISARYSKYSKIQNRRDISGVEVAQEILKRNGLDNVYVVETKGYLSDHFDPGANVVKLSTEVFHGKTISAASIAAHEVGHAIQHKEGNFFMKLRKFIFPVVSICSKFGYIAIFIGLVFGSLDLFYIGIVMLFAILFFQLVTLPVEFDASKKAMANLESFNLLDTSERKGASKVLVAAALTYVASLITTLLQILRLAMIVFGRRND